MSDIRSSRMHPDSSTRCAERTRAAGRLAETFGTTVAGVYGDDLLSRASDIEAMA